MPRLYGISRIEGKPGFFCGEVSFRRRGNLNVAGFAELRQGVARFPSQRSVIDPSRTAFAKQTLFGCRGPYTAEGVGNPQAPARFHFVALDNSQGFASVEGTGWTSLVAPAGTPQAVIDRWSRLIMAALRTSELREKLIRLGVEPTGTTLEGLAAIIAADTAHWGPIVKASGFTLE